MPDGLIVQPAMYSQLQASLDILLETGLDPVGDRGEHRLTGFRRVVTSRFLKLAERKGIVLWHDMVMAVGAAIAAARVDIPKNVIIAGYAGVSPLEQTLCAALAARSKTMFWCAAAKTKPTTRVHLYATPEQECRAVCSDVLRAWNGGAKNLAVVFADPNYFQLLKRCFDDLAGLERPDFEQAIRYNLTIGTPLVEHPLFQTAIIPLRLPNEPLPALLLTSLFVSPYIQKQDNHADSLRRALWAPEMTLSLDNALKALSDLGFPMEPFRSLAGQQTASLADWLTRTQACLTALGFCQYAGQHRSTDILAYQHLYEIVRQLVCESDAFMMSASSALAWLSAAAEKIMVTEKTPETAGIQVLKPAESIGLAFDQLWLIGAHGTAIWPPVPEWPFLNPDEQRLLEGGTIEKQWAQAKRQLAMLMASAPQVHVSRAVEGNEETPYAPCPLLPDAIDSDGNPVPLFDNLWENPTAEWMRARWLREGYRALLDRGTNVPTHPAEIACTTLSGSWSVTAIEDLARCPFLFFCSRTLKLEPLALVDEGIDPRLRGKILHGILKTFTDGLSDHAPNWPEDDREARSWLEQAVKREMRHCPDNIFWQVERLRLLGNTEMPGILPVWLDQERERSRHGWHFSLTEAPFSGLKIAGLILRGRIDRIDHHPTEGFAVWDYKSGATPNLTSVLEKTIDIQLPAYLLALERGLVPGLRNIADAPLQAGYIGLENARDLHVIPLSYRNTPIHWREVLPEWETVLARRVESSIQGHFDADPRPGSPSIFHIRTGACQYCEFFNLCGFFDQRPETAAAAADSSYTEEADP